MTQLRKLRKRLKHTGEAQQAIMQVAEEVLFPEGSLDAEKAKLQCQRYLVLCGEYKGRVTLVWPYLFDAWRGYDKAADGPSKTMQFVQSVLDNRAEQRAEVLQ